MATETEPRLQTAGRIAEILGEPLHRVLHILNTRAHICPFARAGRMRLYDHDALDQIQTELEHIDSSGGAS